MKGAVSTESDSGNLEECTQNNAELFIEAQGFPSSLTKFQMARLFLAVGGLNIEAGQK